MDSTIVIAITDPALALFGIPIGWLAATVPLVIGWINTIKALAPQWVQTRWYPAIGLIISFGYSYITLQPEWIAVLVGGLALFLTQWATWAVSKLGAAKLGARTQ